MCTSFVTYSSTTIKYTDGWVLRRSRPKKSPSLSQCSVQFKAKHAASCFVLYNTHTHTKRTWMSIMVKAEGSCARFNERVGILLTHERTHASNDLFRSMHLARPQVCMCKEKLIRRRVFAHSQKAKGQEYECLGTFAERIFLPSLGSFDPLSQRAT